MNRSPLLLIPVVLCAIGGPTISLRAQNYLYWDLNGFTAGSGGGTTPSGNWTPFDTRWGLVPEGNGPVLSWMNNSVAVFSAGTNATGSYTVNVAAPTLTIGGLQFEEGTPTIGGFSTLVLANPAAGITPGISLNGQLATIDSGISLAGFAGLRISGGGTLQLDGQTTILGTTTIDGVTLRLGWADRLSDLSPVHLTSTAVLDLAGNNEEIPGLTGSGKVLHDFGRLTIADTVDATFSGTIQGPCRLEKAGDHAWTLAGTIAGDSDIYVYLTGGSMILPADHRLAAGTRLLVGSAGTLRLGSTQQTIGLLTGSGSVDLGTGQLTINSLGGSHFSGPLTGSGRLKKSGVHTQTLAGASTYAGATEVSQGTLQLEGEHRLPPTAELAIAAGATLEIIGADSTPDVAQSFGSVTGGGDLTHSSDVASTVVLGADGKSFVFDGRLRGAAGYQKSGAGRLTLNGVSDFTHEFWITGGAVRLGGAERLPATGGIGLSAGTQLELAGHAQHLPRLQGNGVVDLGTGGHAILNGGAAFAGTITATGQLSKRTTLLDSLLGPLLFTGPTRIEQGTLALGATGVVNTDVQIDAPGRLEVRAAALEIDQLTGAGQAELLESQLAIGRDGGSFAFDGAITGKETARLVKRGAGRLTLNGTFTPGSLEIQGGTVELGASHRLSDQSSVQLGAGTVFDLAHHDETINALTGAGTIALGNGSLTVGAGGATFFLTGHVTGGTRFTKAGSGNCVLVGRLDGVDPVAVGSGMLTLGDHARLDAAATLLVEPAGTFHLGDRNQTLAGLLGPGTVLVPTASTLTLDGGAAALAVDATFEGDGRILKNGSGALTYGGTSTGALKLKLNGGGLRLAGNDRFDPLTTLTLGAGTWFDAESHAQSFASIDGDGEVKIGFGGTVRSAAGTLAGRLTGDGTFEKTGTAAVTLNQLANFTGAVNVLDGELTFRGLDAPLAKTTIAVGAALFVPAGLTLDGVVSNQGVLAGAHTGADTVLTGAVSGTGDYVGRMTFQGSFAPGRTLTESAVTAFNGPLKFAPSHTLQLSVRSPEPRSHDRVISTVSIQLGGKLKVIVSPGRALQEGDEYAVFDAPQLLGGFSELDLPALPHGWVWRTSTLTSDGTLKVLSGYAAFLETFGLNPLTDGAPLANPSGDGITNLLKFVMGGNPLVAEPGLAPKVKITPSGGGALLEFTYLRDRVAHTTVYVTQVESSTDLNHWERANPGFGGVTEEVVEVAPFRDQVTVRLPIGGPRAFARLKVIR